MPAIEMLGGTLEFYQPLKGGAGYILRLPEPLTDQAELEAFLFLEMFPGYKPPRTR